MWETWVPSLGWEGSLEKGIATNSSILAWRIPWTEEIGRLQSMGSHTTEQLSPSQSPLHAPVQAPGLIPVQCVFSVRTRPIQAELGPNRCSVLSGRKIPWKSPQATVHGVAKSQTRLSNQAYTPPHLSVGTCVGIYPERNT